MVYLVMALEDTKHITGDSNKVANFHFDCRLCYMHLCPNERMHRESGNSRSGSDRWNHLWEGDNQLANRQTSYYLVWIMDQTETGSLGHNVFSLLIYVYSTAVSVASDTAVHQTGCAAVIVDSHILTRETTILPVIDVSDGPSAIPDTKCHLSLHPDQE